MSIVSCFSLGGAHLEADFEPRSLHSVGNKLSRDVYLVWGLIVEHPNGYRIELTPMDLAPFSNYTFHIILVDKDLIESIKETVRIKLNEWKPFNFGSVISKFRSPFLDDYVESIRVCLPEESGEEMEQCNVHQNLNDSVVDLTTLRYYFFSLNKEGSNSEEFATDDNEGQAVKAALHWTLPSAEFEGLWESLCLEPGLKEKLLSYVSTMLLLSDRGVDSNIITCNRVVLLHGPPGTGKTTLCKALAHKLAIRMADRYSAGAFLEINTHSLFSKWFSESGKLVTQMFTLIRETIARNRDVLTCILIDEVESLTHIRQASESEPSDAIRVVNAVLTQIDQIRGYPNVLILTTSNLTGSIDGAFLDRADINQYIGPPTQTAIYQIFLSCLKELMKTYIY
uniref:AAA+ ATPase domain-containing protein n=1 Tax=Timema poppense TaxID=170557 RepID=A0A7R9H2I4_TIMPO|nr:unnamed protein product [Timema poppensis]